MISSVFRDHFKSALSNGEWASFLGSYLGGVLGGLCTLITVAVTINMNQKQLLRVEQEKTDAQREKVEEERKNYQNKIVAETIDFIEEERIGVKSYV